MKKLLSLIAIIALGSVLTYAQKKGKGEVEEKHEYDKFRTDKSKIIPDMKRLALAQLSVNFKLTTTAKTIAQERDTRKIAGARVSAYLEFTDGDMTKEEYVQLANYFYNYFQKALKAGGIDTVGWSAITAHEFYQKVSDDEESGDDLAEEKGGNKWVTVNAKNGKTLHHGMAGFAGGKGKRAMDFTKDLQATAGFFKLEVDFADVVVNLDIKTTARKDLYDGWYFPEVTKQTYTWGVNPEMRIGNPTKTMPFIANPKGWPEWIMMWNDIESHAKYADLMTEDISKGRGTAAALFAFRKELTPVLIQTTKDKYKETAKKTMEAYADNFVAMCKKYREN